MASALKSKVEDKIHGSMKHKSPEGHHLAAIQTEPRARLVYEDRPTPKPGPGEVLIEVKAIALNPVDYVMRDFDGMLKFWPVVWGNDVAGVVLAAGSGVEDTYVRPGTRVVALCPYFYNDNSDNGGFQEKVIVTPEYMAIMPAWLSFVEGAKLPLAVATAWNGWSIHNLPHDKPYTPEDKKAMLLWGASSSIGSIAVQIAKMMGYTVYATASSTHHEYIKSLGADHLFDYKKSGVVDDIVAAIKADGLTLVFIYDAVGAANQCNAIAKAINPQSITPLAFAPPLKPEIERVPEVDIRFISPPDDREARKNWYSFVYNDWLTKVLGNKSLVPSPLTKLVKPASPHSHGIKSLNDGLDEMKRGVSGKKLVIEV